MGDGSRLTAGGSQRHGNGGDENKRREARRAEGPAPDVPASRWEQLPASRHFAPDFRATLQGFQARYQARFAPVRRAMSGRIGTAFVANRMSATTGFQMPLRAASSMPPVAPRKADTAIICSALCCVGLRQNVNPAQTTSGDPSGDTWPDANRKIRSQFRAGSRCPNCAKWVEGAPLSELR